MTEDIEPRMVQELKKFSRNREIEVREELKRLLCLVEESGNCGGVIADYEEDINDLQEELKDLTELNK